MYDRETVHAVLDEGLVGHVGVVADGQPFVLPMVYGRDGDRILLHGAMASRTMKAMAAGAPTCISVTLVDGLVVARSLFHHSMNYRSVVALGKPVEIVDRNEKRRALEVISEHVIPGRVDAARGPSEVELNATRVVAMTLDEASAKVRTGPPSDEEADLALGHWAGVLPLSVVSGDPLPDALLTPGVDVPSHVRDWSRP